MSVTEQKFGLYDAAFEKSSCGVGFITRKDGVQTHDVLKRGHEALCAVPHRGGMSAEGVGDGAGVSLDLSLSFFQKLTGNDALQTGRFGVGNFSCRRTPHSTIRRLALSAARCRSRGFRSSSSVTCR